MHSSERVRSTERVWRPLRYALVGGATLVVYFGVSLGIGTALRAPPPLAAGAAVLVSGAFNYLAHATVTFPGGPPSFAAAARYFILVAGNSVAAATVVSLIERAGANLFLANAVALTIVTIAAYFILGRWVLRR